MDKRVCDIERSYDVVADKFAVEFFDELGRKPFDRTVLDRFAERVRGKGLVYELGCGPGQIARYLKDRGVEMRGIDISARMVEQAARLNPDIQFQRGDMLDLDIEPGSCSGIVCFYAVIHLARENVQKALDQMNRALADDGLILLSFHGGEGELHREEWYERKVSIFVTLFQPEEVRGYLRNSGFEPEDTIEREPYAFEYPTRRVYVMARKNSSHAR